MVQILGILAERRTNVMKWKWLALLAVALVTLSFLVVGCSGAKTPALAASFSANAVNGAAPFSVSLNNTSSAADQYNWAFGDGNTATTTSLTELVTHEYTTAGSYNVTVTAVSGENSVTSGGTMITVTAGKLAAVTVEPSRATLDIEGTQDFVLTCADEFGNPIKDYQASWETTPAAGAFKAGTFTAGTRSGTFPQALTATVQAGGVTLTADVDITVDPGPLASITLGDLELPADGGQQLQFTAADRYGNPLEGLSPLWTLNDETLGSLTPAGMLRVVKKAGRYPGAVTVSVKQGAVEETATASVTVVPAGLDQLFIAPGNSQLGIGKSQQYAAVGADEYGNRIDDVTIAWSAAADAGTFNGDTFVAGTKPDIYVKGITATATWNGQTLEASTGITVEPDRIVFLGDKSDPDNGIFDVFIMEADGSGVKQLTHGADAQAVVSSPDGRRIAYVTTDGLYIMNTDGEWRTQLLAQTGLTDLSWSPDGEKIVYSALDVEANDANIHTIDVATGEVRTLTDNQDLNVSPSYSPDGRKIAFVKIFPGPTVTNVEIYVMNADGSNVVRVTEDDYWYDWDPTWTPDSQRILYDSERNAYYGLFTVKPDGTDIQHFYTPNDKSLRFPDFSPDGDRVAAAYWSFSTDWEIAVLNADGTGLVRITSNDWLSFDPAWMKRMDGVPVSADSIPVPDLTGTTTEMTRQEVTETYRGAVVRIETDLGSGSGFIIKSSGTIVTNAHVVRDAATITVYLDDGTTHTGRVLGIDTEHDIALVKIDAADLPVIELVAGNAGQLGQQVIVLGYPLGNENLTVTSGIISSYEYDSGSNINWVQTDSAVNPGNSGGPMLNLNGQLVGMVTAKAVGVDVEGVGYAISAETLLVYIAALGG